VAGAIDREASSSYDITVRATSADGSFSTQTYTITVNDENDTRPVVTPGQGFAVGEDVVDSASVDVAVATDADVAGSLQGWTITGGNTDGIFAIDSATGEITVADAANLNFEATNVYVLTLTVSDGVNTSDPATVVIGITNVNETPSAANDVFQVEQFQSLNMSAPGLLANDGDVDGDSLMAVLVAGPTHGSLTVNGDGSWIYTPEPAFNGIDSFSYQASDGALGSNTATVTILVTPFAPPSGSGDVDVVPDDDPFDDDEDVDELLAPSVSTILPAVVTESDLVVSSSSDSSIFTAFSDGNDAETEVLVATLGSSEWNFVNPELSNRSASVRDSHRVPAAIPPVPKAADALGIPIEATIAWDQFDELQKAIQAELDSDSTFGSFVAGSATAVTTSLSVGYAMWLLRGGSLLASVMTSLPAWRMFDPLPLLEGAGASVPFCKKRDEKAQEEETLNEMFAG
jgi:hypothetical protein